MLPAECGSTPPACIRGPALPPLRTVRSAGRCCGRPPRRGRSAASPQSAATGRKRQAVAGVRGALSEPRAAASRGAAAGGSSPPPVAVTCQTWAQGCAAVAPAPTARRCPRLATGRGGLSRHRRGQDRGGPAGTARIPVHESPRPGPSFRTALSPDCGPGPGSGSRRSRLRVPPVPAPVSAPTPVPAAPTAAAQEPAPAMAGAPEAATAKPQAGTGRLGPVRGRAPREGGDASPDRRRSGPRRHSRDAVMASLPRRRRNNGVGRPGTAQGSGPAPPHRPGRSAGPRAPWRYSDTRATSDTIAPTGLAANAIPRPLHRRRDRTLRIARRAHSVAIPRASDHAPRALLQNRVLPAATPRTFACGVSSRRGVPGRGG